MVYYAVYYSTKGSGRVKNYAGEDKVDYICHALNEMDKQVCILSNAKTTRKHFAKKEKKLLYHKTSLLYFSSLPKINIIVHAIDVLWGYLQLFLFVLFHVNKTDTVLVYHSLGYRGIWGLLHKIKRFNYILEVEEIFSVFAASKSGYKKHEQKVFKYPDKFLFSNVFLEEKINVFHKPFAIVNGVYAVDFEKKHKPDSRDLTRVVYAGSLEKQKGVDYIILAAREMPSNYEIRIIGFGTDDDIERVHKLIGSVKGDSAIVKYDGVYKGKAYKDYLASCDIGICIQDPDDNFNKYEYPSKIFSYLSSGLQVVTNDLIQVRRSDVFPYIHIANGTKPKEISKAILSCDENYIDPQMILSKLDELFKEQLLLLVNG